jgi:hypothetical protein
MMSNEIENTPVNGKIIEKTTKLDDGHVRVRYSFGDNYMEVEGSPDYVERHVAFFISQLQEKDTPLLADSDVSPAISNDGRTHSDQSPDLVSFYTTKAPEDQRDEVLMITYFYQKYRGYEHLSLDDYTEAYNDLRRAAVGTPRNMKSSVRNVVDRTSFLYNPVRGQFVLTIPGEQYVERMGTDKTDTET